MKKFYIPTSTLNFNNILSSESISPKAFYEKRNFGYPRFNSIPENNFQNAIVLYDYFGTFTRPKCDVEDHPMLIEVLLDENKVQPLDKNTFYIDRTVYLTPQTTRFIFFSEQDKNITQSMSESSSETKLVYLYNKRLTVENPQKKYQPTDKTEEPCELNEEEINNDILRNKMKGLLYGYYIGAFLFMPIEDVRHLNVLHEIYNIFAAINASPDKQPTQQQNEQLTQLHRELNPIYQIMKKKNIDEKDIKEIFCNIDQHYTPNDILLDKNYCLSQLKDNTEEESIIEHISCEIEEYQNQIEHKLLSPNESEIVVLENKISAINTSLCADDIEKKLFLAWINDICANKYKNGKISTYKKDFADDITRKAKEIIGEQWENSHQRAILNALRHHIAGEAFDYKWDNALLSSISAVVIEGDDWGKLWPFMQRKEMTDYRLAFAIYGTLNGFANLTRDFTDLIIQREKEYVWEVYKKFYRQLFGEDIPTNIKEPEIADNAKEETVTSQPIENAMLSVEEFTNKLRNGKLGLKKDVLDNIVSIYDEYQTLNNEFFNKVKQIKGVGQKKIDKIKKLFEKSVPKQQNLFGQEEIDTTNDRTYFYCDKNSWQHIEDLIDDNEAKKKIKEDLEWFQKEFQKTIDKRYKYYQNVNERNNKVVIEKFCSLKEKNNQAPYFTQELRDKIKEKLLSLYCNE